MKITKEQLQANIIEVEKKINQIGIEYGQEFPWHLAKGEEIFEELSTEGQIGFLRGSVETMELIIKELGND